MTRFLLIRAIWIILVSLPKEIFIDFVDVFLICILLEIYRSYSIIFLFIIVNPISLLVSFWIHLFPLIAVIYQLINQFISFIHFLYSLLIAIYIVGWWFNYHRFIHASIIIKWLHLFILILSHKHIIIIFIIIIIVASTLEYLLIQIR